jgi:hypothetical protein
LAAAGEYVRRELLSNSSILNILVQVF